MKLGFLKSKKFKYSTLNIAFIAVVVLVVILFNAIISIIADKNNWYIDMTEEQIFSLSDSTKSVISGASKDVEIEIIFSSKKDLLENKRTTHQASVGFIVATAEELANEFDNISVSYHDIARENKFYMELSRLAGPTVRITESSVLVARKDADGNYTQVRSYSINNFFATDEEGGIHAYGGEITFASAILSLTAEKQPTVYFTIGHGEASFYPERVKGEDGKVKADAEINHSNAYVSFVGTTGAYREAVELMRVFTDAGYIVKPLDISNGGIPEDASIIVINAPARDFKEEELDLLTVYLKSTDEPGTLFCFFDKERQFVTEDGEIYEDKNVFDDFGRLNAFIEARTGSKIVADNGYIQDPDAQSNDEFYAVNGEFPSNNAINVYLPGRSDANVHLGDSVYIERLENATHWDEPTDESEGGYREGSFLSSTMPLVITNDRSGYQSPENNKLIKGKYTLMTMTAISYWRSETQEHINSYILVGATSDVVSTSNLQDGSYVNRDLMYSIIRTTGGNQAGVPLGVEYKNFIDYDLNISRKQANTTTWCLALILPIAIAVTVIVVIVKRKRR